MHSQKKSKTKNKTPHTATTSQLFSQKLTIKHFLNARPKKPVLTNLTISNRQLFSDLGFCSRKNLFYCVLKGNKKWRNLLACPTTIVTWRQVSIVDACKMHESSWTKAVAFARRGYIEALDLCIQKQHSTPFAVQRHKCTST